MKKKRKFILIENQLIQELFFDSVLDNWLIEFLDSSSNNENLFQEVKTVLVAVSIYMIAVY